MSTSRRFVVLAVIAAVISSATARGQQSTDDLLRAASAATNQFEAIEDYKLALAIDSQQTDAWIGLGLKEFDVAGYAEAAWAFEQARALDPNNTDLEYLLGLANYFIGDLDTSARLLTSSLNYDHSAS